MKKLKSILSPLLICFMLTTSFYPALEVNAAPASAIIADHEHATLADLLAIPMEWINQAKSSLKSSTYAGFVSVKQALFITTIPPMESIGTGLSQC